MRWWGGHLEQIWSKTERRRWSSDKRKAEAMPFCQFVLFLSEQRLDFFLMATNVVLPSFCPPLWPPCLLLPLLLLLFLSFPGLKALCRCWVRYCKLSQPHRPPTAKRLTDESLISLNSPQQTIDKWFILTQSSSERRQGRKHFRSLTYTQHIQRQGV